MHLQKFNGSTIGQTNHVTTEGDRIQNVKIGTHVICKNK